MLFRSGELFESGNTGDLKKKIRSLWKDRGLTEQYARNCRELRFDDVGEYSKKLMKLYKKK